MRHRNTVVFLLAIVSALAVQPASSKKDSPPSPLSHVRDAWMCGFNSGNADAVLALYADNATVVSSAGTFKGRELIRRWVQAGIDQGSRLESIDAIEEKSSGSLAYGAGTSRRWVGKELHRSQYLIVMVKTGKDWKIVHHFSMAVGSDSLR